MFKQYFYITPLFFFSVCISSILFAACGKDAPPTSRLSENRDSLPVMTSYGVSKLISDSGYLRYRIITEEWDVYDLTHPPRQVFPKGLFVERYDDNFNVNLYIEADSAWLFDNNLWKLIGNVRIIDKARKSKITTEELYWNMNNHQFYSNKYTKMQLPDRAIEGNRFTANESMTEYHIYKSKGFMPMRDNTIEQTGSHREGGATQMGSTVIPMRTPPEPRPKY